MTVTRIPPIRSLIRLKTRVLMTESAANATHTTSPPNAYARKICSGRKLKSS